MENQELFAQALEAQKAAYENLKGDIERQNGKIDAQTAEIRALTERIEIGGMSSIEEGEILKTLNAQVALLQELSQVVPEPPVVEEPTEEPTEEPADGEVTEG